MTTLKPFLVSAVGREKLTVTTRMLLQYLKQGVNEGVSLEFFPFVYFRKRELEG